jgi:hypothetical protein
MKTLTAIARVLHTRLRELDRHIIECQNPKLLRRYVRTRRRLVKRWRFMIGAKPPLM